MALRARTTTQRTLRAALICGALLYWTGDLALPLGGLVDALRRGQGGLANAIGRLQRGRNEELVPVLFQFPRNEKLDGPGEVYLVGSWSQSEVQHPLRHADGGDYRLTLMLPPGQQSFKVLKNGKVYGPSSSLLEIGLQYPTLELTRGNCKIQFLGYEEEYASRVEIPGRAVRILYPTSCIAFYNYSA